jgi:hypothetical protein
MEAEGWPHEPLSTRPGETFRIKPGSLEGSGHLLGNSVRKRDNSERKSWQGSGKRNEKLGKQRREAWGCEDIGQCLKRVPVAVVSTCGC